MAKRYTYRHKCVGCGVLYESTHKDQRYHSKECYYESLRNRIKLLCEYCGAEFETLPSKNFRRFCSKSCADKASRTLKTPEKINATGDAILALATALNFEYNVDSLKCNKCGKMLQNGETRCLKCDLEERNNEQT